MQKLNLNLSGGMNVKTSPLIIKDSESELILNYHLDKLGALTRRNGYVTFASQPVANKTICGLFGTFNPNNRTGGQVMSVNNSGETARVTYYNLSGTWTISDDTTAAPFLPDTGSAGQLYMTRFLTFVNYAFRVTGGNTVATAPLTNLATWGTTNAPGTITPSVGEVFQDRVYFNYAADNLRSRVYFSSLPSTANPPVITWDTTNDWFNVNPDDNDAVTAFENNGNRLLIFKNFSMYRWTFGQVEPDRIIGVGTMSQESVKTNFDLGITFFANPKGIYAYTDGRPKLISRKIQDYIDAVSDWKYVAGGVDSDHYYLSVGNVTVSGRTFTNAVFCYHISLDAWTIYSMGVKPTVWAEMTSTYPTKNVYFGSTDGRTYQFNSGTSDSVSNTATSIAAEFISKEYLLSYPNRTNINYIDFFATRQVGAGVFYDTDRQGLFPELGALTQRISNFQPPLRECNSVRVKVADNSQAVSVIEGFNIEHEPKEKRDEMPAKIRRRNDI